MSYGGLGEENKSIAKEMMLGRERIEKLEALVRSAHQEGWHDRDIHARSTQGASWHDSDTKAALEGTEKEAMALFIEYYEDGAYDERHIETERIEVVK